MAAVDERRARRAPRGFAAQRLDARRSTATTASRAMRREQRCASAVPSRLSIDGSRPGALRVVHGGARPASSPETTARRHGASRALDCPGVRHGRCDAWRARRALAAARSSRRLRDAGHEAYFAGGCVRDRLLGARADATTTSRRARRPRPCSALFPRTVAGRRAVRRHPRPRAATCAFEVATFRADDAYVDGRRPASVRFTHAPRRTRGGATSRSTRSSLDPFDGEVLDFVGGQARSRARHRPRDRRSRGAASPRTACACCAPCASPRASASPSSRTTLDGDPRSASAIHRRYRRRAHRRRGREDPHRGRGAPRLRAARRDRPARVTCCPEIAAMQGVAQSPDYHPEGDVFDAHAAPPRAARRPALAETLALGALLHDVAKPVCARPRTASASRSTATRERGAEMAEAICQRLRRSRDSGSASPISSRNHLRLVAAPRTCGCRRSSACCARRASTSCSSSPASTRSRRNGDLDSTSSAERRRAEIGAEEVRPPRCSRGHDLMALGYEPGPAVRARSSRALEEAQLEGTVDTREQALELVRARFPVCTLTS